MAKKPDGKPASVERVSFTRPAAERIGKAVRQVEAGKRDLAPIQWGPRGVGGGSAKVFRVGSYTGDWSVDTAKVVTFRNVTTTPNTVHAINLLISLPAGTDTSSSRICNIAKDGTDWYLVSFRAVAETAVFARQTQTITYVGASSTHSITFATPGSSVAVVTNIAAALNTANCAINITQTTASVQVVGATQTAAVVSTAALQTAAIVSQTYTATYIRLDL
jgi:hypothetical protein